MPAVPETAPAPEKGLTELKREQELKEQVEKKPYKKEVKTLKQHLDSQEDAQDVLVRVEMLRDKFSWISKEAMEGGLGKKESGETPLDKRNRLEGLLASCEMADDYLSHLDQKGQDNFNEYLRCGLLAQLDKLVGENKDVHNILHEGQLVPELDKSLAPDLVQEVDFSLQMLEPTHVDLTYSAGQIESITFSTGVPLKQVGMWTRAASK